MIWIEKLIGSSAELVGAIAWGVVISYKTRTGLTGCFRMNKIRQKI